MLLYVAIAAAVLTSDAAVARGGAAAWCPTLHTIQGNDPSAPFLADDGTWHVFVTCTSSGNWQHYISRDLMRWAVLTPTGFDAVTGSVGSADGQNLVAFWGNTSKPFPCCDIQASAPASASNANLTSWRPLGRTIARPHNLSLHQGFRDPLRPLKLRGKWRMGVGSGSGADQTTPLEGRVHWFTAQDETLTTWSDSGKVNIHLLLLALLLVLTLFSRAVLCGAADERLRLAGNDGVQRELEPDAGPDRVPRRGAWVLLVLLLQLLTADCC